MSLLVSLLASVAMPEAISGMGTLARLGLAVALLGAGAGLVALEFLVVSGGLIAMAAVGCLVASVVVAFTAGEAAGWAFLVATPIVALLVVRAGLRWMNRSNLVVQAEVTADAGYRHAADAAGAAVGSIGELITAAYPTGRARFPGGELDVLVQGPTLPIGARVAIIAIDGPTITVGPADPA